MIFDHNFQKLENILFNFSNKFSSNVTASNNQIIKFLLNIPKNTLKKPFKYTFIFIGIYKKGLKWLKKLSKKNFFKVLFSIIRYVTLISKGFKKFN